MHSFVRYSESFGSVESVKAASDVYLPVSGEVTAVNELLDENPGLLNEDAMGEAWFVKVKMDDPKSADSLLDDDAYAKLCAEESE